jgi:hypothetical protein
MQHHSTPGYRGASGRHATPSTHQPAFGSGTMAEKGLSGLGLPAGGALGATGAATTGSTAVAVALRVAAKRLRGVALLLAPRGGPAQSKALTIATTILCSAQVGRMAWGGWRGVGGSLPLVAAMHPCCSGCQTNLPDRRSLDPPPPPPPPLPTPSASGAHAS